MVATCKTCERKMDGNDCEYTHVVINGVEYERVRFVPYVIHGESYDTCHDCGVESYGVHHVNCDMETCPACGNQLLGCQLLGCTVEEYGTYDPLIGTGSVSD